MTTKILLERAARAIQLLSEHQRGVDSFDLINLLQDLINKIENLEDEWMEMGEWSEEK